jgi:predicted RNA-binding Zn-ribbon protein involved in translation (DUF1610 family)
MELTAVKVWLVKRKATESVAGFAVGTLLLLAGLVVLVATCWLVAKLALLSLASAAALTNHFAGTNLAVHATTGRLLALMATSGVLLFVSNARLDRERLFDFTKVSWNAKSLPVNIPLAMWNAVVDLLVAGPRMVAGGVLKLAAGFHWLVLDIDVCAPVLEQLLAREQRVTVEEIKSRIPRFEVLVTIDQLRLIEGVVFLESPAGFVLTTNLRRELGGQLRAGGGQSTRKQRESRIIFSCQSCGRRLRLRTSQVGVEFKCPNCRTHYRSFQNGPGRVRVERLAGGGSGAASASSNPGAEHFAELGLPETATLTEVKRAYRKLMKEHHPDMANSLQPEQRATAEEKAKRVNLAYEALMTQLED